MLASEIKLEVGGFERGDVLRRTHALFDDGICLCPPHDSFNIYYLMVRQDDECPLILMDMLVPTGFELYAVFAIFVRTFTVKMESDSFRIEQYSLTLFLCSAFEVLETLLCSTVVLAKHDFVLDHVTLAAFTCHIVSLSDTRGICHFQLTCNETLAKYWFV